MTANKAYLRAGSQLLIVVAVGGFIADYLFNVGLSRLLPAHDYGDFKVAYAFVKLSGTLVLLGGDRAAPHVLAGRFDIGDNTGIWEYFCFYCLLTLALSVLLIIGTLVASRLHLGPVDLSDHHPLAWTVFAVPLIAVGSLFGRILQSAKKLGMASLPWRIVFPLLKLSLITLAAQWMTGFNLEWVIVLALLSVAIIVIWQGWVILQLKLVRFVRAPDFLMPRQWLTLSIPLMGGSLLALVLAQSDLYLLEMLGDEHEVGYFAAAAKLIF